MDYWLVGLGIVVLVIVVIRLLVWCCCGQDHKKPGTGPGTDPGTDPGTTALLPVLSDRPVASHSQDSLDNNNSSLVISDTVRINIHPQEKGSISFGAFADPVNRL